MSERLVEEYLTSLEKLQGFACATVDRHRRVCSGWVKYLVSTRGVEVGRAEPEDLLAFVSRRSEEGAAEATIRSELCVLRTLYEWLLRFRKIVVNPAASLPRLICLPAREKLWLTVEECFRLVESFDTSTPTGLRDQLIVALLWSTGLRNRELVGLRWEDVDLDEGTLLVRRGKGGKQRQVFLNDRVCQDLVSYRQSLGWKRDEPVFFAIGQALPEPGSRRPLSASRLVEVISQRAAAAGLAKQVNPLTFRHTFATHMYEAGTTVEEIKEMLGHDDESETSVYLHVTLDAARQLLADHVANPDRYAGESW
jgi:site-specific recombinase XerD